ncbi:hypothetical protein ASD50_01140 [Mesorhizobium sp. Root552]|nr:hypothetical protein ASD50_01140 [Mesorhizobium sp. Root552]
MPRVAGLLPLTERDIHACILPRLRSLRLHASFGPGHSCGGRWRPYASIFGGINFLHDNDFQIGSSDPSLTGFSVIPAKMFFDPGGIVGAAVGYDWGSFAAEAELSGRRGIFDHEEIFVGSIPLDGHYDAISVMANAYYRFHNDTHFIPYVGAGAGVAFLSAKVTPSGAPPSTSARPAQRSKPSPASPSLWASGPNLGSSIVILRPTAPLIRSTSAACRAQPISATIPATCLSG